MFQTTGIQTVASITELRSKTAPLIDHVQKTGKGVLVQRNNTPEAVLLSYDRYLDLAGGAPQADGHAAKPSTPKESAAKKPRKATKKE